MNKAQGILENGIILECEPLVKHSRNGNGYLTPIVFDSAMMTLKHGYTRKKKHSYGTVAEQLISGHGVRPFSEFYAVMMGFPKEWIE